MNKRKIDVEREDISKTSKIRVEIENHINVGTVKILHFICDTEDFEEENEVQIKFLLDLGADINCEDGIYRTPFYLTCLKLNTSMARFLIEHGAKPTLLSFYGVPFFHDVYREMYKEYKGYKNYVNQLYGRNDIFKFIFIENKSDINLQDTDIGDTLLHIAFRFADREMIIFLIQNGADKNIKNKGGYVPRGCLKVSRVYPI